MITDWILTEIFKLLGWVASFFMLPGVPEWVTGIPAILVPMLNTMGKLCNWVPWTMAGMVTATVIGLWIAGMALRIAWSVVQILGEWVPTGG